MAREETGRDGISRRTLIAGSAWAVPVVALTVATPLAAASQALAGCGTDYQLTAANQQGAFVENTSATAQVVTLVLQTSTNINGVTVEDQATFDAAYLVPPTGSGTVNGLPASYSAASATEGTITFTVPVGATFLVQPDVSFGPGVITGTLTATDGACAPIPLTFTFG